MYPAIKSDFNTEVKWHAGVFIVLAVNLLVSIVRTIKTSPGTIPDHKEWDMTSESDCFANEDNLMGPMSATSFQKVTIIEKKKLGGVRICQWCFKTKPDRCHHCSQCN